MTTKTEEITNSEDVLDSRDIIERIEYLEELRDEFVLNESATEDENPSWSEIAESQNDTESKWDETEEGQEYKALVSLRDELESYCDDWKYGVWLIRESYWVEYCEELCEDIGEIPSNLPWYIANHIDWEGVAREIKVDYTEADFDGITYYAR